MKCVSRRANQRAESSMDGEGKMKGERKAKGERRKARKVVANQVTRRRVKPANDALSD